jgi:hypothetical protein
MPEERPNIQQMRSAISFPCFHFDASNVQVLTLTVLLFLLEHLIQRRKAMNSVFAFFAGLTLLLTVVPTVWVGLALLVSLCIRMERRAAQSRSNSVVDVERRALSIRIYVLGHLSYDESVSEALAETHFLRVFRDLSKILLTWKSVVLSWLGLSDVRPAIAGKAIEDSPEDDSGRVVQIKKEKPRRKAV